ncbi:hypothetical protein JCM19236_3748 [Vibrio sp. JCM 19236]|nr:hypothetical protein JCM19236_3748 [Vibrio sp. JCM 19236]
MNSWMASEGHCKNIMSANVTQMVQALLRTATLDMVFTGLKRLQDQGN